MPALKKSRTGLPKPRMGGRRTPGRTRPQPKQKGLTAFQTVQQTQARQRQAGVPQSGKKTARKATSAAGVVQRPRRMKLGTKVSTGIRRRERSTGLHKPPLARLCKEILRVESKDMVFGMQGSALVALQEACEAFLVRMFMSANLAALHANRVTFQQKDMRFAIRLLKDWCPYFEADDG